MVNRRTFLGAAGAAAGLGLLGSPVRPARAAPKRIVFTSWGGTTQDAQKQAWAEPFTKKTGIEVLQDGPTDYGKLRAMIEAGQVQWDVVDVEEDFGVYAGDHGLAEPLDFSVIDKAALDPRFVTDHTVGSFYYAFVLGYAKGAFGKTAPQGWADLFDLKGFPGKRALYKWSAPGVLEIALLADGVAPEKLYPLDLDRAFRKLDTIKPQVVWWGGGAQSQQLLASGETPIGMFWNGRLFALRQDGQDIGISWAQNLTTADVLMIPKGTQPRDAAMKFLALATSAKAQAEMARLSGYAPINLKAIDLLSKDVRETLPSSHAEQNVPLDVRYWAEHREEIGKRWYAWQAA